MEKVNETMEILHAYQKSALLFNINKLNIPLKEKARMMEEKFPNCYEELLTLDKYINYQNFNYELWKEIGDCLLTNIPKIKSHDDLNLKDYLVGLNQRNRLVWKNIDFEKYFDFMVGKVVLDFGCGGCFYSDIISKFASKVYCYDKPDVINFVEKEINIRKDKCKLISNLNEIEDPIEVAWVSEVIHGKDLLNAHNILLYINEILAPEGMIVINELLLNTPLGKLFDTQMKIHTKGGRLYNMEEMQFFFNSIKLIKTTDFHWTIGGELL